MSSVLISHLVCNQRNRTVIDIISDRKACLLLHRNGYYGVLRIGIITTLECSRTTTFVIRGNNNCNGIRLEPSMLTRPVNCVEYKSFPSTPIAFIKHH